VRWTLQDFGVRVVRKDGAGFQVDSTEGRQALRAFSTAVEVLRRAWLQVPKGLRAKLGDQTLTLHATGETVHDLQVERIARRGP
jgi:hypothetical protein